MMGSWHAVRVNPPHTDARQNPSESRKPLPGLNGNTNLEIKATQHRNFRKWHFLQNGIPEFQVAPGRKEKRQKLASVFLTGRRQPTNVMHYSLIDH